MTERDTATLLREALEARDRLAQQTAEMEMQAQQLQDQASEMEAQQAELEQQTEELQSANEELQRVNEQLHSTERFVSGVLAAIADPFVVHDAEWRFRYVNEAAASVFSRSGRGGANLVGKVLWDVYPDIVGTNFERHMRHACETQTPVVFEELYPRAGTWAEIRCYPLPDGGVATLWKDTTDKKRAEETIHYLTRASEILSSSLEYEKTVQAVADLLVPRLADWCAVDVVDGPDRVKRIAVAHVDPAKAEWAHELNERYPVRLSEPIGLGNVLRTGKPELYADITEEMLVAGARDEEHLRITRELGIRGVIYVPIFSRGEVVGVMTLVSAESGRRYTAADVTLAQELARRAGTAIGKARLYREAVRAREEAEQQRRAAEEANRAKGQFLAHMSHELRTPLNAIGGYAQLLQIGVHGPVNAAQDEALERIQRSQRHLLGLINDVLNFAKLEAGHVGYDISVVKIADCVCGLETLVAPQLAAKSLTYECVPVPPELAVSADADKLQQIMLNLLSNAIKFTPSAGHVRVSALALGDAVTILVADTGIGIPADRFDAIFEPFVQLGRSTTGGTAIGQDGTGLGLAISRDLARAMGGDLTVRSTPGEGSIFELRIPLA
ncbi:MAG TPA: ATP-binding protein [Gemmatimonadaceae bacterium]|nr:ATP-binding protein [Gemmatimonadaceae bacterium]